MLSVLVFPRLAEASLGFLFYSEEIRFLPFGRGLSLFLFLTLHCAEYHEADSTCYYNGTNDDTDNSDDGHLVVIGQRVGGEGVGGEYGVSVYYLGFKLLNHAIVYSYNLEYAAVLDKVCGDFNLQGDCFAQLSNLTKSLAVCLNDYGEVGESYQNDLAVLGQPPSLYA